MLLLYMGTVAQNTWVKTMDEFSFEKTYELSPTTPRLSICLDTPSFLTLLA